MLFSKEDRQSIEAAVRSAESKTAGELVVAHTERADDYAFRRSVVALGLAIALGWEALLALPSVAPVFVLVGQAPAFFLFYWLTGLPPVVRLLVSDAQREVRTQERAMRAFIEQGVTETRDRSGVLIFIGEAERKVVIVADKGINDRVEPDEWRQDVQRITDGIRAGRAAPGVLESVERIGSLLAEAFPARADDENELGDSVRQL